MADQLPLPSLLSHALVAFTIELDNEFEHQMPHRTRDHGSTGRGGPWLVSMVMWFNCMQFVGEEPMPVAELERRRADPDEPGRHAALGLRIERSAHRFGATPVARLRADLERLVGDPGDAARGGGVAGGGGTPLMRGLEPYPDNWRASVPPPRTLPHFPMVLHRGGYPDGS